MAFAVRKGTFRELMELSEFFSKNRKAAIAFSGGVDSSLLLYAALRAGADCCAYYVKSAFQPEFELEDAKRLAAHCCARMKVLTVDIASCPEIMDNPKNRCYLCKKKLFTAISSAAAADGYTLVLDGSNASDKAEERPGMKALAELEVESPLRLCGLTKEKIRELSKEAGLFTWNKPAYACLATRIPTGTKITAELLYKTEKAEALLSELGFTDFRVRYFSGAARLQLPQAQLTEAAARASELRVALAPYFDTILLDLEAR